MSGRASDGLEDFKPVFRQVVIRALCDALGFTNLDPTKSNHSRAIKEAQRWFHDGGSDFSYVCDLASVDTERVRRVAIELIQAKATGDHSRVPEFWRIVFAQNRMPNLTGIEKALDAVSRAA